MDRSSMGNEVKLSPERRPKNSFNKNGSKKLNPRIKRLVMTKRIQGARER